MRSITVAALSALTISQAMAQSSCRTTNTTALSGTVRDSTQALIPGASVSVDGGKPVTSGADGRFRLACLAAGKHQLSVQADGFEADQIAVTTPSTGDVPVVLQLASVTTDVTVNADEQVAVDPNAAGPTARLEGKQLQSLADDPDDLLRELQQMAAAAGGNPANTTIAVDGFGGDSSKLPPKSSIAYIEVNPDLFSSEYRNPPFGGGQVNVYTKPGQSAYHGALFTTNGSSWENARDPFSTDKGTIGKQRYGFELTGPVRKQGSDFSLDLEHRSINNVGVVNAVSLNSAGQAVPVLQTVATPQRLWIGQARLDWQLGAKDAVALTYSANVNSLQNVGVGGTNLAENGYNSGQPDHVLRVTNLTTFSPHLVHEARASFHWSVENDIPASTATQIQVAGSFTGGGSTLGAQRLFGFRTEFDEDAILTLKQHTLKFGYQVNNYDLHNRLTTNFNGTYTFGGGAAPVLDANNQPIAGQTQVITGFEQYRRATLQLSGGTPTAFSNVAGNPNLAFTQSRIAFFVQDSWKLPHGVLISSGLRYFFQTDPTTLGSVQPRVGILWSPGAKPKWTLYAHAGLFAGQISSNEYAEVEREDGVQRVTSTVYNPVFNNPFSAGAVPIHSVRSISPHIAAATWSADNIGGSRELPFGFSVSGDFLYGRIWNDQRSPNVNAPLNGVPTGPRALGIANVDNLQINNSGQGHIFVEFLGVQQHSLKNVTFFGGMAHVDLLDDTDDSALSSPQSSFTDAGEVAYRTGQGVWQIFGNGSFTFPKKIVLSGDLNLQGDAHYNVTTGFDNNGDGNFNDRPNIALPGTPGAVATRYGLLVDTGGIAPVQRNVGIMPWTVYLDTNIQRAFVMTHNAKAEHQQTVTVNLRSSNVLNHTNITAVGGVLGSPLFGVGYQADPGRRVEAGLRYSF